MALQRKLIREKAVELLIAADTAAGARVSRTRVEPHKRTQLPALSVYTLREPIDVEASGLTSPRELVRELRLEVVGWVSHSEAVPVDDAMDDIAEQVEQAMDEDPYLDGLAMDSILEETTMQVVEDDGRSQPLVGIVTLTYAVTYRSSPASSSALDDFETANTTHQITGGVPDTAPIVDTFTVEEPSP